MTADTKLRTLNDQLESETADSERYNGGDWWQLTDEEESIFAIDRERLLQQLVPHLSFHCG